MILLGILAALTVLGVVVFLLANRVGNDLLQRLAAACGIVFGAAGLAVALLGSPFHREADTGPPTESTGGQRSPESDSSPSPTSGLPAFTATVNDKESLARLVDFLDGTTDERMRLDVTVTDFWAGGGERLEADSSSAVTGWIGEPGCSGHDIADPDAPCYGTDLYIVGQRDDDLENGFFWLGQDRYTLRGAFRNLGATMMMGVTEWGLQVVRSPEVT